VSVALKNVEADRKGAKRSTAALGFHVGLHTARLRAGPSHRRAGPPPEGVSN